MNIDSHQLKFSAKFDETTSDHIKFLYLILRGIIGFLLSAVSKAIHRQINVMKKLRNYHIKTQLFRLIVIRIGYDM